MHIIRKYGCKIILNVYFCKIRSILFAIYGTLCWLKFNLNTKKLINSLPCSRGRSITSSYHPANFSNPSKHVYLAAIRICCWHWKQVPLLQSCWFGECDYGAFELWTGFIFTTVYPHCICIKNQLETFPIIIIIMLELRLIKTSLWMIQTVYMYNESNFPNLLLQFTS